MTTTAIAGPVIRSSALDRVRGLAIALMIGDHLAAVLGRTLATDAYRLTFGRVAMPLFFLLSGHLVRRFSRRTAFIGLLGLVIPAVVPWIDTPNVLFLYAVGAFFLTRTWYGDIPSFVFLGIALTLYSNGFLGNGSGFAIPGVLALMVLGKSIPRRSFSWGERLPRFFDRIGRYPVTIYVTHLVILTAVFL